MGTPLFQLGDFALYTNTAVYGEFNIDTSIVWFDIVGARVRRFWFFKSDFYHNFFPMNFWTRIIFFFVKKTSSFF